MYAAHLSLCVLSRSTKTTSYCIIENLICTANWITTKMIIQSYTQPFPSSEYDRGCTGFPREIHDLPHVGPLRYDGHAQLKTPGDSTDSSQLPNWLHGGSHCATNKKRPVHTRVHTHEQKIDENHGISAQVQQHASLHVAAKLGLRCGRTLDSEDSICHPISLTVDEW